MLILKEMRQRSLTMPPLLLLRLASMLSAWVVMGLFWLVVSWGEDRPMMLPRFSGWALGSAGIPPPAAAQEFLVVSRSEIGFVET